MLMSTIGWNGSPECNGNSWRIEAVMILASALGKARQKKQGGANLKLPTPGRSKLLPHSL
jgi:hypothetical protein